MHCMHSLSCPLLAYRDHKIYSLNMTREKRSDQSLKLLSSHLSVYNALTNPDLELLPSPNDYGLSRFSSAEDEELRFIDNRILRTLSNSPFVPQASLFSGRPASLLSISTDDEMDESLVIVTSPSPGAPGAAPGAASTMVFDTDEEDADVNDSFIMPTMSLHNKLTVTLLSSDYQQETNELVNLVKNELNININFIHLRLESSNYNLNHEIIRNSNLIFIVNDGSLVFTEYFKYFNSVQPIDEDSPKLTIINMMTVNYFTNLFELINNVRPYQMWKTSSLNSPKLLDQFKDCIETEVNHLQVMKKSTNSSDLLYSSLISNRKPDYKRLERKFKSEFSQSSSHVNPLNLSLNKLSKLNCLLMPQDGNGLYVVASFVIGVSLGIGFANGLTRLLSDQLSTGLELFHPEPKEIVQEFSPPYSLIDKVINGDIKLVNEITGFLSSMMVNLRLTSELIVSCVKGGASKLFALVL